MAIKDLLQQLENVATSERLAVIEEAVRLVRDDLCETDSIGSSQRDARMRAAAKCVKDLYERGGEHTEWTVLDSEDFLDDTVPG